MEKKLTVVIENGEYGYGILLEKSDNDNKIRCKIYSLTEADISSPDGDEFVSLLLKIFNNNENLNARSLEKVYLFLNRANIHF